MADLTSRFSREDIETLIEATGDWEMVGNQEFHIMQMVNGAPMPPEDNEAYEIMVQIKEHYQKRERDIKASRVVRQEKAVFLKAKLMLVRKDLGINQLFDMAGAVDATEPPGPPVADGPGVADSATSAAPAEVHGAAERLGRAEFFIRDLGVWDHYQKFLAEQQGEKSGG